MEMKVRRGLLAKNAVELEERRYMEAERKKWSYFRAQKEIDSRRLSCTCAAPSRLLCVISQQN
jgi:hypothetical protein